MSDAGSRIEIDAPAKLNLGLEVIGQRDDGFHEIATLFLAIDRYDHLALTPADDLELICDDVALAGSDNLALRALRVLREETGHRGGAQVELSKRIPAAAGLGGASSDAAAALLGGRDLWRLDVSDDQLHEIASRLGSDVPFFLRGGCALGRGRGELLEPLPLPRRVWFVVVVPEVTIPGNVGSEAILEEEHGMPCPYGAPAAHRASRLTRLVTKTANLYASLTAGDFSDGSHVTDQAARLRAGLPLDETLLGNAFARPLYALVPELAPLPDIMREAGAEIVAISGAGPAHYAVVTNPNEARRISIGLRDRLGDGAEVFMASPVEVRHESR